MAGKVTVGPASHWLEWNLDLSTPPTLLVDLMRYGTLHLFHVVNWPVALRADDVT